MSKTTDALSIVTKELAEYGRTLSTLNLQDAELKVAANQAQASLSAAKLLDAMLSAIPNEVKTAEPVNVQEERTVTGVCIPRSDIVSCLDAKLGSMSNDNFLRVVNAVYGVQCRLSWMCYKNTPAGKRDGYSDADERNPLITAIVNLANLPSKAIPPHFGDVKYWIVAQGTPDNCKQYSRHLIDWRDLIMKGDDEQLAAIYNFAAAHLDPPSYLPQPDGKAKKYLIPLHTNDTSGSSSFWIVRAAAARA